MNQIHRSKIPKTVLITGAANGIGYEFAQLFASDGYSLVLVDKDEEKLADVVTQFKDKFQVSVTPVIKDLSLATSPLEIFSQMQQASIKIDVLVNNAGFGKLGFFTDTSLTSDLAMLQVNLVCLTHLTKLFLPDMVKRGEGKILNVSSTAAFQPGPLMAIYFATKSYILSFSEAIANELEGTGVSITVLCPGPTHSAFHQITGMAEILAHRGTKMMNAATVAKIGYHGLMTNKTVVIPGWKNKILAKLVSFIPRNLITKYIRSTQEAQLVERDVVKSVEVRDT
jgi:uncharacterized protein